MLLILGLGGLAACTQVVLPPAPAASAPWPLGPGDRLRIIVFEQNQLGGEFSVDEDGAVSLPLIGRLKVAGLLPGQVERLIAGRLAGGIVKNPKVNIDVIHYRPVYVYGEVTRPGAYEIVGNPTVIGAVTLAGGYTYRAQTDGLSIVRYGDPERRRWAATDITPVGPGDVVFVPERWF
ncbi:MAG TPA: polysaccharide biosynthesis/export family protein [Stellaceae bacterium]|nr:polysaccharide biosynthesis/export family protein [Stellaceae bacterium]